MVTKSDVLGYLKEWLCREGIGGCPRQQLCWEGTEGGDEGCGQSRSGFFLRGATGLWREGRWL